ncbi:uncharacterized protein EDB93DRAFT_1256170 [Suillus bovinus]|uniref:uncharacterized protein n=1 Tax=Suillus bovinus TaxID=48563 RepID=UPI001B868BB0|nr:uncharacterized protein EDB93DRAFT_1256170 [Suillus bovinus]KAG2129694.1 hypothetical protein EDB93DRAFT_1256170 [Suillus bovinus]
MYKNIALSSEDEIKDFLACLRLRPMHIQFAKTAINSLYLDGVVDASTVLDILSLCTRVEHLALLIHIYPAMDDRSSLWLTLNLLPLKSLVLYMGIHFINCITTSHVLKNLTHVDLIDRGVLRKPDTGLEALHSLTHICLVLQMSSSHPAAIARLVRNARLCVLAFHVEDSHSRIESFLEGCGIQDERIVLLSTVMVKWDSLGRTNMLLWELLEETIRLPKPKNKGHRCLSHERIIELAGYESSSEGDLEDDFESDPDTVPCSTYSMARTKG